jgi:hypothetical protein
MAGHGRDSLIARSNVESRNVILKSCHSDAERRRNLPPSPNPFTRSALRSLRKRGLVFSHRICSLMI